MWIGRLVFWFVLIVGFGAIASNHAEASDKPPTPLRVAHELGYRLAVDPRVTYPPQDVNCWWPATDRYDMECQSYLRKVTKKSWQESVRVYGVKLRMWEDGSWSIRSYMFIGGTSEITIRA